MGRNKITQDISSFALIIYFVIDIVFTIAGNRIFHVWYGAFIGWAAFVVLLLMQQRLHRHSFRKGIRLLKAGKYNAAIAAFKKSAAYFNRYPLLDKWRHFLLISPSTLSCKEMALKNILACYVMLKNNDKASFYYETLLAINSEWKVALRRYDDFLNKQAL